MAIRLLLVLSLMPTAAFGYEPERARNNLAHELAECAAYYHLSGQMQGLTDAQKKAFTDSSASLMQLSISLTSVKVGFARFELSMKTMTREMDNNWENYSIVLNKYAFPCKDLAENPDTRLRYWLDKRD
jgi:hypothetical protein